MSVLCKMKVYEIDFEQLKRTFRKFRYTFLETYINCNTSREYCLICLLTQTIVATHNEVKQSMCMQLLL